MSFFPYISVDSTEDTTSVLTPYYEIAWDYTTDMPVLLNGDFKVVEGVEAIKVWCYKALKTPKLVHPIYSTYFGSEIDSLIGTTYSIALTKAETERYIDEALSINEYVLSTKVVSIEPLNDVLKVDIYIDTIYGGGELSIVF